MPRVVDGYPGAFPPEDTGGSGLAFHAGVADRKCLNEYESDRHQQLLDQPLSRSLIVPGQRSQSFP
jgi:hypothetical protein